MHAKNIKIIFSLSTKNKAFMERSLSLGIIFYTLIFFTHNCNKELSTYLDNVKI